MSILLSMQSANKKSVSVVGNLAYYVEGQPTPCDYCEICGVECNVCSDEPAIEFEGIILCSKACLIEATEGDDREEVRLALEAA